MKKLMMACALLLGIACISLAANEREDKGDKKKEAKTECCCKECACDECTCNDDCDGCKDCRKVEACLLPFWWMNLREA